MDYATILTHAAAVLAGILVALRVIAPLTRNKVDDRVVEYGTKLEDMIKPKK